MTRLPTLSALGSELARVLNNENHAGDNRTWWSRFAVKCLDPARYKLREVTLRSRFRGLGRPEYLVDVAWIAGRLQAPPVRYRGILLAAEIEWGGTLTHLWEDFPKLVDIQAERKVFVGNIRGGRKRATTFVTDVVKMLRDHRGASKGERYFISLWEKSRGDGFLGAWIVSAAGRHKEWRASKDGNLHEVQPR